MRQVVGDPFHHVFISRTVNDINVLANHHVSQASFPLYIYPKVNEGGVKQQDWVNDKDWWPDSENSNRTPNLSPAFIADLEAKLTLRFNPIQRAVEAGEFGPEDVFHYIYAILHSPTYRKRYAEFLKIDFPRVPLTADPALFWALAALGRELVGLHLLESPDVTTPITRYPVPGDNRVEKGYPKYTRVEGEAAGRVHINQTQYFDGVPEDVWAFHVGGYQVLDKWLKDRRGRQLSYDDLTHYQRVVVALRRTMALMEEIDATIPDWPIG